MDRSAVEEDLAKCYARVLRALIGVAGSRQAAEDALHDAIVAALKPRSAEQIRRLDAWLFAVGLRMMRRGRLRRLPEIALDLVRPHPAVELARDEAVELLDGLTR